MGCLILSSSIGGSTWWPSSDSDHPRVYYRSTIDYVQTKHLQSFLLQYLFQGRSYNLLTALTWCPQMPSPWDNADVRSLSASHLGFSVGPGLSMLLISLKWAPLSEQMITCLFCSERGFFIICTVIEFSSSVHVYAECTASTEVFIYLLLFFEYAYKWTKSVPSFAFFFPPQYYFF